MEIADKNRIAFRQDLISIINCHSQENGSNTPDFILADYLMGCLEQFEKTSNRREEWYGLKLTIQGCKTIE